MGYHCLVCCWWSFLFSTSRCSGQTSGCPGGFSAARWAISAAAHFLVGRSRRCCCRGVWVLELAYVNKSALPFFISSRRPTPWQGSSRAKWVSLHIRLLLIAEKL